MAEPTIRIVRGGPMLVDGLTVRRLTREDGAWTIEPVEGAADAICRCGTSTTMPFCDRPAPYGCFEEEPPTGPAPGPFTWDVPDPAGPPAIALKPNGPVRVAGDVPVTYDDDPVARRDRVSLCRCGASRCQPLCDSSHKIVGYRG